MGVQAEYGDKDVEMYDPDAESPDICFGMVIFLVPLSFLSLVTQKSDSRCKHRELSSWQRGYETEETEIASDRSSNTSPAGAAHRCSSTNRGVYRSFGQSIFEGYCPAV